MMMDPNRDSIFNEQIETLYRTFEIGVLGAWVAALAILATLVAVEDLTPRFALVWGTAITAIVSYHQILKYRYGQLPPDKRDRRLWACLFTAGSGLEGLWWGSAVIGLPAINRFDEQIVINCLALIVGAGAVPAFGSHLPAFYAIILPLTLVPAAWHLTQSGPLHMAVAFLIGVFLATALGLGKRAHFNLTELMRLRFEKEALADDLRRQKEQAEQANLAKSRFLASASHDLRQPVHALGMFVSALSNHAMSDDMRGLVTHIEDSVQAMEGLFGSLLDVSRLDAGIVEPQRRTFALSPMLDRVCGDYAAEATEKGVKLTICPTSVYVHSDPVLLERILRNIVSNAVRYTDHGRVLVGCRRGRRISVQVCDTGRGISLRDRERIFEEFYQVGNSERDRSQGLGLGLAIVKRLTALLDHPLDFYSVPGKGSCFRFLVPAGQRGPVMQPAEGGTVSVFGLSGTSIFVIDDDPAVLESMRLVLTGWGADVVAARSGAEIMNLASNGAGRPGIILCDYRLRNEESGIDVIRRLHEIFGVRIPAILITGDTAANRIEQAHASGLAILYKPVANSKLRALIGNLMREREKDDHTPYVV
jgi:two-component system, sensor histidine kinase